MDWFVVSKNNREETAAAMTVSAARITLVRSPTATSFSELIKVDQMNLGKSTFPEAIYLTGIFTV